MAEHLVVDDATKTYPGGNAALKGASFSVDPGDFMVLLGPSGSGKTTLLRSLAGIERLTSGRIVIGGTTVADDRTHLPPERRDLSMVFQDYALWPHLRALDNIAFALRRHRLSRGAARQRAVGMLERVGLAHLADRYPAQLSGGEQQRVALARALVADTALLLCDEPLSNLDADLRERMRVEIASLVRDAGATTIYITHDQLEAFALADRVGVLQEGALVQLGTPEDVYHAPANLFVARFTGLAGEVRVRPVGGGSRDGTILVEPLGTQCNRPIEARVSAGGRTAPAVLAVRPTGIRLCDVDADVRHLAGRVSDTAFRGRSYELVVDLLDGTRMSGIHSERRVTRGTAVGLVIEPAGSVVFPADAAGTIDDGPRPADAAAPVQAGGPLPRVGAST